MRFGCCVLLVSALGCSSAPGPRWAAVKAGTALDPASGLPMSVADRATGIELVLITPGTLVLPSWTGAVAAVDRPFYMGKFETTWADWEKAMGPVPRRRERRYQDGQPVDLEIVGTEAAHRFLRKTHFRLPTAREYYYVMGKGLEGSGHAVDSPDPQWHVDHNMAFYPSVVGRSQSNAFGMYDVTGNMMELTAEGDWLWCCLMCDSYLGLLARGRLDGVLTIRVARDP